MSQFQPTSLILIVHVFTQLPNLPGEKLLLRPQSRTPAAGCSCMIVKKQVLGWVGADEEGEGGWLLLD